MTEMCLVILILNPLLLLSPFLLDGPTSMQFRPEMRIKGSLSANAPAFSIEQGASDGSFTAFYIEQGESNGFEGDPMCQDLVRGETPGAPFALTAPAAGVQSDIALALYGGPLGEFEMKGFTNVPGAISDVILELSEFTNATRGQSEVIALTPIDQLSQSRPALFFSDGSSELFGGVAYLSETEEDGYEILFQSTLVDGLPAATFSAPVKVNIEDVSSSTRLNACGLGNGLGVAGYTVRRDGEQASLQLRFLDGSDGTTVGDEFQANTSGNSTLGTPALACLPGFGFVIAWTEGSSEGSADGDGNAIAARFFDTTGTPLSDQLVVNQVGEGSQSGVDVAFDGNGNAIFAWTTSGGNISLRGISTDGTACSDEFDVPAANEGVQAIAALGADGGGDLLLGWTENSMSEPSDSVYGIYIDAEDGGGPDEECADPIVDQSSISIGVGDWPQIITASDALFTLNAAVGLGACELCVCDVDDSGAITASDALAVLKLAVGIDVPLNCPAC